MTPAQLPFAWRSANPIVDVATVGNRGPKVNETLLAAKLGLGDEVLARIDQIKADATPVAGPSPEMS